MEQDRRAFNRFDIFVVLEFRFLRDRVKPFLGVTKNVSVEGLCIDTQCEDFQAGEALEVTLKHPEADRFVTLPGTVIWKHKGSKFASVMGITLAEADLDSRNRMLEILAAAGDIPVDHFFLKEQIEHTTEEAQEEGEAAAEEEEAEVTAEVEKKVEPVHAGHVHEAVDHEINHVAEQAEQTEAEDTVHEETAELNLNEPLQEEMDLETDDNPLYAKTDLKSSYRRYAVIAGILLVLLYAFMSYNSDKDVNDSLQVAEKPPSSQKKDETSHMKPAVNPPAHVSAGEQKEPGDINKQKEMQETAVQTRKSVPAVKHKEYILQVGSWKNEDNARRMLTQLKKYYPDTYVVIENDLKKIRVPGITDRSEGEKISKDIERKFGLKPLLLVKGE